MSSGLSGAATIFLEQAPIVALILGFGLVVLVVSWVPRTVRGGSGSGESGGGSASRSGGRLALIGGETVARGSRTAIAAGDRARRAVHDREYAAAKAGPRPTYVDNLPGTYYGG